MTFILLSLVWSAALLDRAGNYIRAQFGPGMTLEQRRISLPAKIKSQIEKKSRQRFFRRQIYSWRIRNGNSTMGYAMLDNVYGKTAPITFLVVFDTSGMIRSTVVLKYRESHGGQVQNKVWLKQFTGRGQASKYRVGREVSAISGATISVNAMARGIKKLGLLFPFIRQSFKKQKGGDDARN